MEINFGLLATNLVSILIILGVPTALGIILIRKYKISPWVMVTGLITFVVAQALFYFANTGVSALLSKTGLFNSSNVWAPAIYAIIIGLLMGLFTESARLAGLMFIKKKVKSFRSSIVLGIGHGAFSGVLENMYNGWTGFLIYFFVAVFYNPGAQIAKGQDLALVQSVVSQVQQFWTAPWHYGLVLGVESLIMLSVQVVLSILVWKAISYRQWLWFFLAVLYHTLFIGISTYLKIMGWGTWVIEAALAVFLLINVYVIYSFWKEESEIEADEEYEEIEESEDDEDLENDDDEEDDDVDEDKENEINESAIDKD